MNAVVMMIVLKQVIGIAAGTLTAASMMPQLIKTIKEKKAAQVSVLMLVFIITGVALWIWYGILIKDWPIIITNSFSLLLNGVMIYFRYKYRKKSAN